MAYLSPDLVQKALSITSGYKNGGTVAPMKRAASALEKAGRKGDTELVHVTPGELSLLETIGAGTTNPVTGLREFFRGDQQSKDVEGRSSNNFGGGDNDDPSGMADLAAAAEEATRGMSDEERTEAAEAAVAAMDRESRDSDREADDRAITRLFEEETLKATLDNIAAMQGDTEAQARIDRVTGAPTAAEAIEETRGKQKEQGVLALAALEAAERAARPPAPVEREPTVVEQALEQAVSTPVDFFDPGTPAQRGGLYSSALAPTQPTYLQDTALNNLMGGPTPSVPPPTPVEYTEEDLAKAQAELASAQFATPPAFGMAAGKPRFSQMGILGGIADAFFNPEATLANAISERGIASINDEEAPKGREGVLEVVQVGGRTAAYDPERNIVFDSDPFEGIRPFSREGVPEEIQALYDKKRAVDKQNREREGEGDGIDRGPREPITEEDVIEDVAAPELPPTIDIVPFRPEDFYYFTPGSFAYNRGIPSMMNMRRG